MQVSLRKQNLDKKIKQRRQKPNPEEESFENHLSNPLLQQNHILKLLMQQPKQK